MKFINLTPGNWFELKNIIQDKTHPYDIDAFKKEILDQVNNRSEKLSIINISFGSRYAKTTIEEITFHLAKDKFNRMIKMMQNEKRHPIITFHGTNLDAVKSILANGYIIPQQNKTNNLITKTHGAVYGIGVYSSPFFDKAMYYTTPNSKHVYILINMVFPGTMKMIPQNKSFTNFDPPENGIYADGSNTRVVYGLEQFISADAERVIPIAVMKISVE